MAETLPPIFQDIPATQLMPALMRFKKLDVEYGTVLMEEGDEDPALICILEGEVEVKTGGVELGKAGAGDLVGEMAVFGHGVRTATVRSTTPCKFMVLDRENYEALRDGGNPVAKAIEDVALNLLTTRLRDINYRISRRSEGTKAAIATPKPGLFRRVAKLFGGGGGRGWALGADKAAALRKSALFKEAPDAAIEALAAKFGAASFATGHFLCTQGDYGREMFLLAEGEVEVLIALGEDRVEPLATLDPGDAFGMVSLVEDLPRMASCVAKGPVTALTLDSDTFKELTAAADPAGSLLRTAVIKALIDQLAYANGQLAMLDASARTKSGEFLKPLLRANAGMEAHGRHVHESPEDG